MHDFKRVKGEGDPIEKKNAKKDLCSIKGRFLYTSYVLGMNLLA